MKTLKDRLEISYRQVSAAYQKKKRLFADSLSQRFDRLSESAKKVSLLLFGLIMGGASFYFIINPSQPTNGLKDIASKLPTVIPKQPNDPIITQADYRQLLSFKQALDSLRKVDPIQYEQLVRNRSGLLDSLDLLITIYHKQ